MISFINLPSNLIAPTTTRPLPLYGHFFWCQRRNILDSQCRICTSVFKWDNDDYAVYQYSNNLMDFWDTHLEKLFCENTYLYESEIDNRKECVYFENFYTAPQLINMFGVISCRIFLNLGKRCFFCWSNE